MRLIADLQLLPTSEQADALRATLERSNAAANRMSAVAWEHQTFRRYELQKLVYYPIRKEFELTAELVVRIIAKVSDAYKLDRKVQRVFRPLGSIAFDDQIVRYKANSSVSIWTTVGRQAIPFVCGERQRAMLATRQGESDLVYRDGKWFLLATCNVEEPPEGSVDDFLGVDLGIKNIATDSDGTVYSGAVVNGLRRRHRRLRRKLQRNGSHAARRLLQRRRTKESRFARDVNHTISKRIVAVSEGTGRGIALEKLTGIHARITARRDQRASLRSWSFEQLGLFITYKAKLAGVPLVFVDPRNTSRTCPACRHVDKANRRSQSSFLCVRCGVAGLADHFAAVEIGRRASAVTPYLPVGESSPVQG